MDFVFFDAGGGHRAAANALLHAMDRRGMAEGVRLVNLQEVLDGIDVFRKLTGIRLQDLYNIALKKGWTLGSGPLLAGMHGVIRLFHRPAVRALEAFWSQDRPDLADYPPHFWMERQEQYFICGTARAVEQAHAMGHPAERVFRVQGMILAPRFYDLEPLGAEERAAARARLGFHPEQPVGLVLFGGQGAAVMLDIARRLPHRQLLMICGHNHKLAGRLRTLAHPAPLFVEGFTREVPRYMQLADYFIGKPGPGSISEAVAMRLPVIVENNAWTLPQERYNTEWVREQGVGLVLRNFRDIRPAVERLLEPAAYQRFREATGKIENRAAMEIPSILESLAGGAAPIASAQGAACRHP